MGCRDATDGDAHVPIGRSRKGGLRNRIMNEAEGAETNRIR